MGGYRRIALSVLVLTAVGSSAVALDAPDRAGPCDCKTYQTALRDEERNRSMALEVFYPLCYVEKAPAPPPLVVFRHGFLVSAFGYSSYAEQLVSHGFAIALPSFPTSFLNVNHATLAEDVRSVIDHLLEASEDPDHPLFGRIDPDRIHSSGHSLEGKLGLLEAVTDEQVGAIVVLDAVDEGNPLWSDPVRYPSVASELMPTSTFRSCSSEGSSERF